MTANHFQNMYADHAASAMEDARVYLQIALERLGECDTAIRTDGDWDEIAKLASNALECGDTALTFLATATRQARKRASFS